MDSTVLEIFYTCTSFVFNDIAVALLFKTASLGIYSEPITDSEAFVQLRVQLLCIARNSVLKERNYFAPNRYVFIEARYHVMI